MSIIKNEYPILEFDADSEEILKPNHSMESTRLQEKCVYALLGDTVDVYSEEHGAICVDVLHTITKLYSQTICAEKLQTLSTREEAQEFIEIRLSEDLSSLDGMYKLSPEMEKSVTSSGGWAGLAKSLSALGEAEKIGPAYADTYLKKQRFI